MPMTVNTAWLLEYLEPKCAHEDVIDALPRLGLEIERRYDLRAELEPVRIGFVRDKVPLAEAPGLYVCQIELARGDVIPVVCASEHEIRVGWGVPVARAGVALPTGRTIRADQFHGVRSEGMICVDGELGLVARGSGLHHVTDESLLGAPLPAVADIPESLLELNVLPNRPDFLGIVGIAREVAALLRLGLRYPPTLDLAGARGEPPVAVEVREPELCRRYMGGLVRDIRVAPSPPWLKARLLLAGMRPISNVVDITNYVMYEWGQPLHAFDARTLAGGRIVVRRMAPGETLELLTGAVIGAPDGERPLVIADAQRPVALAGVMGGRATQTTDRTTEVLVEAAHFDPVAIRRTAQRTDLGIDGRGTASSYRFERGTDPNRMLEGALGRAVQLLAEVAGGTPVGPLIDQYPQPCERRVFRLSPQRASAYLGMPVDVPTIRDCLTRLSMECSGAEDGLEVRVPTWRADVNDPVVLIEDVARLVGYDRIPVAPQPALPSLGLRAAADRLRQVASERLVAAGFYECRNPSLESPKASAWLGEPPDAIALANWATREMSALRRTLVPGLVGTAQSNLSRGAQAIRFFEVDRVFGTYAGTPGDADGAMQSRWRLAGIAGGRLQRSNWRTDTGRVDFYTLKGAVEDLLDGLGVRGCEFRPVNREPFVAGTAAEVLVGASRPAGVLGELGPTALGVDRPPFPLFAFELDLEALEDSYASLPSYRPISRQPAVSRDLAVVIRTGEVYADIADTIRRTAGPDLESLRLVDRYQGPQVPQGHQSLAFNLVFRNPERTLTSEEVAEILTRVLDALKGRFGAELRG